MMPRAPVPKESAEQRALFDWLRLAAPEGLFATAIPGGDGRATRTPGFRPGTPDILMIWRGRAILIEMKRQRGGRVSDEQTAVNEAITLAGGVVYVARGWTDAARWIATVVPVKGRIT